MRNTSQQILLITATFKIWLLRTVEYLIKLLFLTNKVMSLYVHAETEASILLCIIMNSTSGILCQVRLPPTFSSVTTVPNEKP